MNKVNKNLLVVFVALSLVYLIITLLTPPDPASLARYNVSALQLRLIGLTVSLPLLIIYLIAIFGVLKFRDYSDKIKDSKDGQALSKVSMGLLVLVFGLPIGSIISSVTTLLVRFNETMRPSATIFRNYWAILVALVAFYLIFQGSKKLRELVKKSKDGNMKSMVVTAVLSLIYLYLIFQNPNRTVPTTKGVTAATFYLPDILIFLTIAVPYIIAWYFGISAAMNIGEYQKFTKGIIYKKALRGLSTGIIAIVISSIFIQSLSVLSAYFGQAGLGPILLIVYVLLIIIAIGYVFIAKGAKKLALIEEVTGGTKK